MTMKKRVIFSQQGAVVVEGDVPGSLEYPSANSPLLKVSMKDWRRDGDQIVVMTDRDRIRKLDADLCQLRAEINEARATAARRLRFGLTTLFLLILFFHV